MPKGSSVCLCIMDEPYNHENSNAEYRAFPVWERLTACRKMACLVMKPDSPFFDRLKWPTLAHIGRV